MDVVANRAALGMIDAADSSTIPTAGTGAGAGAGASTRAAAARPRKRARTSDNSTAQRGAGSAHATRATTGVVATASVATAAQQATAEEVAGQFLMDKTAAEALAATGFTPRGAESPHVYKAGHAAFLALAAGSAGVL